MTTPGQVVDALIAGFTVAVKPIGDGPDAVRVIDGPGNVVPSSQRYLLVGATDIGDLSADAVTTTRAWSDLGPGSWLEETGTVYSSVWVSTGGDDQATSRDVAEAVVEACAAWLAGDPYLGGLLLDDGGHAYVSTSSGRPSSTERATGWRTVFTVTYSTLVNY